MPRESGAARRARMEEILRRLRRQFPETKISLDYGNDFQLLVAVVLSAQCTDAMVNRVTRPLFAKYRSVEDFANADPHVFEKEIRATGYYRAKTRHVLAAARAVRDRFGGHVPDTMDLLVTLPGVGRKTANVILWNAFGKQEGIAVDTHVTRIARLLRFTRRVDPRRIEEELLPVVAPEARGELTHLFIEHGRATCKARRPRCEACTINPLCPSADAPNLSAPRWSPG